MMKGKRQARLQRRLTDRRNRRRVKDDTNFSSGSCYIETAISGTSASFQLRPSIIPRENTISDTYQMYRFVKLTIDIFPFNVGATNNETYQYYGWYPGGTVTAAPSNIVDVSQLQPSMYQSCLNNVSADLNYPSGFTVDHRLRLTREDLLGENSLKFWKTQGTSGVDQWDYAQGYIFIGLNRSVPPSIAKCNIRYVIEYAGKAPTGSTSDWIGKGSLLCEDISVEEYLGEDSDVEEEVPAVPLSIVTNDSQVTIKARTRNKK